MAIINYNNLNARIMCTYNMRVGRYTDARTKN